jgi:hypothetical protein
MSVRGKDSSLSKAVVGQTSGSGMLAHKLQKQIFKFSQSAYGQHGQTALCED